MCTNFSRLQQIGANRPEGSRVWRDRIKMGESKAKALVHLRFVYGLYAKQLARGCYSLLEHPTSADLWTEPCVQKIRAKKGTHKVIGDQCLFGQQNELGEPVKTPTGFLTNSVDIAACLEKRCRGLGGACS